MLLDEMEGNDRKILQKGNNKIKISVVFNARDKEQTHCQQCALAYPRYMVGVEEAAMVKSMSNAS